jgi:hypothetical protein
VHRTGEAKVQPDVICLQGQRLLNDWQNGYDWRKRERPSTNSIVNQSAI